MNSDTAGSVTGWIKELKSKNPEAQQKIWNRFVKRLVSFANQKLKGLNLGLVDANDIANMAFHNFFEKSPEQFESLVNRNDLWQILVMLAERRAIDEIRRSAAQKHGSNRLINESMLPKGQDGTAFGIDQFEGRSTSPEFELILSEEFEARLDSLPDELLRRIAIEKMQGYKNKEIADSLALSLRSVERKLGVIRDIFKSAI